MLVECIAWEHPTENLVPPPKPTLFTVTQQAGLLFDSQPEQWVVLCKDEQIVPKPTKVSQNPVLDRH